jgi:hypothetical protein
LGDEIHGPALRETQGEGRPGVEAAAEPLERGCAPAGFTVRFEHRYLDTGTSQHGCRRQPTNPGTDHHDPHILASEDPSILQRAAKDTSWDGPATNGIFCGGLLANRIQSGNLGLVTEALQ